MGVCRRPHPVKGETVINRIEKWFGGDLNFRVFIVLQVVGLITLAILEVMGMDNWRPWSLFPDFDYGFWWSFSDFSAWKHGAFNYIAIAAVFGPVFTIKAIHIMRGTRETRPSKR